MGLGLVDRENAIISSFLFANDVHENLDDAFILDESIFSTNFKKRIVAKLNEETNGDQMYGYQNIAIEEKVKDTPLVVEWIEILAQNPIPLSVAKRLYDDLVKERMQRIAMGVVC